MNKLKKLLITTILLLFSISIFSKSSSDVLHLLKVPSYGPEGSCGGYGISGGKLDISKEDQICRFDNLMKFTYKNSPERFIYPVGNTGNEIDIYKSYEEMISKFPGDKLINEFGLRRLLKAHMILQNPDVVSSKLVKKLDKVVKNIIVSLNTENQKDLAKHTKTLKGEKSGIHHVSGNGYKAYFAELSFANNIQEKLIAEQKRLEQQKKKEEKARFASNYANLFSDSGKPLSEKTVNKKDNFDEPYKVTEYYFSSGGREHEVVFFCDRDISETASFNIIFNLSSNVGLKLTGVYKGMIPNIKFRHSDGETFSLDEIAIINYLKPGSMTTLKSDREYWILSASQDVFKEHYLKYLRNYNKGYTGEFTLSIPVTSLLSSDERDVYTFNPFHVSWYKSYMNKCG